MFVRPANRWQAFGIHALVSLFLFLVLASIICFWWYPGFLFLHDGGIDGMKLIAGVDFFIGPVLTLCVYKIGKKGMVFDMVCIALFQLLCLSGGMWSVWKTRPIAVVFAAGSFVTVNSYGYASQKIDISQQPLLNTNWPVWLGVKLPQGDEESIKNLWVMAGTGVEFNVENYVPYGDMHDELKRKGLRVEDLKKASEDMKKISQKNKNVLLFLVKTSEESDAYLAVDVETGKELGFFKR